MLIFHGAKSGPIILPREILTHMIPQQRWTWHPGIKTPDLEVLFPPKITFSFSFFLSFFFFTVDNTPPVIEQLDDITITVSSGEAGAIVSWTEPTVSDDSGTVTLTSRTRSPNTFFPAGTTSVTYTYSDPSGNTASMTFNVIINVESE